MGKVFLVAIVIGFAWGAWKVYGHWTKTFHLDEGEKQVEASATMTPPSQMHEPPVQSASDVPDYLTMLASSSEWVMIRGEGIIERGQEITGDLVLLAWDRTGAWFSRAGQRVRIRWERTGEAMRRIAQEMKDAAPQVMSAASINPLQGMGMQQPEPAQ